MSEGGAPAPQAAAPQRRSPAAAGRPPRSPASQPLRRHAGPLDPRAVPCSALGVKDIHAARTMGPPSGAELVSPAKRLQAHEHEPRLPPPAKPAAKERRKAPLDQAAPALQHHDRDFISTNVQAAATVPKPQEQEEVRYVFKEHYGELPPYLRQRKQELVAARAAAERAQQAPEQEDAGADVISGEALANLIRHLKLKWQDLNQAYVKLPCVVDTPSKRRRKEELEAQLAEIERDVRMLSNATSVRISSK